MKSVNKPLASLAICSLFYATSVMAGSFGPPPGGGPPHGGPQLTATQKSCLQGQGLPEPGSGTRPSHEQVEAAFKACGIQAPSMPPPREPASEENQ